MRVFFFFYFSNEWGRNFAIYLRRKTPIKHMNLRHVNIVSQSYIGNTALRYTSKQIWAAQGQDARPAPPGHGAPAPTRLLLTTMGFGNGAEGSGESCARQKLLGVQGCSARFCSCGGHRRNAAGERLPRRPAPKGIPLCNGSAQRQQLKNKRTEMAHPPNP